MRTRAQLIRSAVLVLLTTSTACSANELIQFRSGQSGRIPGTPGQSDDSVRFNPWGNPSGAPVLGSAFTATEFNATAAGNPAVVVQPQAAWMGGNVAPLNDPLARWINFEANPFGPSGSALYAVPFVVNTQNINGATISFEGGVDEVLGDWSAGGANPDGLYINGHAAGYTYQGFNFANPTTHSQTIPTSWIHPGQNYLYFYQRDVTHGASGIIFSGVIEVIPAPGSAALAAAALCWTARRRR